MISEYKGQRVMIDPINKLIYPQFLIRRVLPSGSKAATPSEYKIRNQVVEITEQISPGKTPGCADGGTPSLRLSSVSKNFKPIYHNKRSNIK